MTDNISGFRREINKVSNDPEKFFNWFESSLGNIDTSFIEGHCIFSTYMLSPVMRLLKEPHNKTALEIGYGGGKLLFGASSIFKEVIGIDIHDNDTIVKTELNRRGITNFKLIQCDGQNIPAADNSIDFVYSNVVLQHVGKIDIFNNYLKETFRILKSDGISIIYFGRLHRFSLNKKSKLIYVLDRHLDKMHSIGYEEISAEINSTNLRISLEYAKRICAEIGFNILGEGVSKKIPELSKYGGQFYLVLKK